MNRIFTLIAMCVFTIGAAFAEETTIDFVSLYNSDKSVQPATPITSGAFSFSYEKGNSINAPAFSFPLLHLILLRKCAFTVVIKKANLKATL